jgi:hypothetical protein
MLSLFPGNSIHEVICRIRIISLFIFSLLISSIFWGCEDHFETNPDDIINTKDYINSQSEMYSGFLGILSKMQEVGDDAVFLTDTRGDFLEPTANAPEELWDIYNYQNTTNNSFADPAGFYSVIVACNDYFDKMFAYKEEIGEAMSSSTEQNFEALISSALRIKVWVYLTLGKIYGEAIYFDAPLNELEELREGTTFSRLNTLDEVVDKCLELLDGGVNGIEGDLTMNWGEWLDPEDPDNSEYVVWNHVTPDYLCMRSELCLLKGIEYDWVREQILSLLSETFQEDPYKYRLNAGFTNNYYRFFAQGTFYSRETISSIIYDYSNHQTNNIITYFGKRYPAEYLLRPSGFAINKYGEDDTRGYGVNFTDQDGDTCVTKYHINYRWRQPYQSDPSIPLFRGHDLHFMLAEAENHLGHWDQAAAILNGGIAGRFTTLIVDATLPGWDPRYQDFIDNSSYPNIGICGCVNAKQHELPKPTDEGYNLTEEERIKVYDLALLDEMLLEYAAEGRSYGMMIRMAKRYNDWSIIADRVCPKYPVSMRESIRSKIMSGEYFVDYDLGF